MKRKNAITPYIDADIVDEILTPIKLSKREVAKRIITIQGFRFLDTGYALACPTCGKISGISCREDVDLKIDWFLKFGCEHYQIEGQASE